jgi:hypothetical protein
VFDFNALKERHRAERESQPEATSLRIHRALSWLEGAEQCADSDATFMLLWVAFNAAYGQEFSDGAAFGEQGLFRQFLGKLVRLDADDLIYRIAWENYAGKLRVFISNQYVCRHFWDFKQGRITEEQWLKKFEREQSDVRYALGKKDTVIFLNILFDRLYTLRNQLMHGGASWGSQVNRSQVTDGGSHHGGAGSRHYSYPDGKPE